MPLNNTQFKVVPSNVREWGMFWANVDVVPEDFSVTPGKLADGAVETDKIASGAVASDKIAASAVEADKIATDAVETAKIKDEAVTLAKVQQLTADRILGRLTTAGSPQELTATQVRGLLFTQQSNITNATTAHALSATYSDTEVEAALDALGSKINEILTALDNLNLTA